VVANLAISWRRRQRFRARRPLPAEPESRPEVEPPDPQMMTALRSLSPSQRAVVVLRYFADQSVEDVARALGKRAGTVRALSFQGLERLRDLLGVRKVDDEVPA
jgi:RNA polymerase sigma factor (sigma-70 family)